MLFLKWFASRSVRHAWQAAKHVEKTLRHQRDLLSTDGVALVQADIDNVRAACRTGTKADIKESLVKLEKSANKWLKSYPHSALRENIEVALVAIAVAMGIRTFFLQPFKIPTGSMQPTLYGVTPSENSTPWDREDLRDLQVPNRMVRFFDYWFNGVQYFHVVAKTDGELRYSEPTKFVLFNLKQNYSINGVSQPPIWFPPDLLFRRAGVSQGSEVHAGDDILKIRVISGDHLFVDRVSYNFRRPSRGDIVVFETRGIQGIADQSSSPEMADTYYIKRLCGLSGERLSLKKDYDVVYPDRRPVVVNGEQVSVGHLVINGTHEITASTPHFEFLYSFPDAGSRTNKIIPFRENHYRGHALLWKLAPGSEFDVRTNCYFVMGDNTLNSSDSRYWGDFERNKVIGKSFFVYWPIGGTTFKGEKRESRFGWAHR